MSVSKELAEILACPRCKGALLFPRDREEIHCVSCRLIFPIENGIPVMLLEEARPLAG